MMKRDCSCDAVMYISECVRHRRVKKNCGGNLRCIFIIYSLLEITISSLDRIEQTYGNYFSSDVGTLQHVSVQFKYC
jgi:hypothetical protein